MIGKTLDRYRIECRLGEGATGVVYRAHDLRLGRAVALKLLHEQLHENPNAWSQLLAEARITCSLNHPNICTVYEVGEEDGQGYISMEYVDGKPLHVAVAPDGLPAESIASLGAQVAEALQHAHERGIVHGDVKSANIVVTAQGQVKVLDFGLAQRLPQDDLSKLTVSHESLGEIGPIAGTLPYLAPEQLRGKAASVRTDLWSLGVVLYEMATGDLPFKGDTAFEISMGIMVDSRVLIPAQVPPVVRPVVERCLEKDPARRYQRAADVCHDLRIPGLSAQGARPRRQGLHRGLWAPAAGIVSIAVLIALGIPAARRQLFLKTSAADLRGVPSLSEQKVLGVVPFRVTGDAASLGYIAQGLTDALSTRFSQETSISVIPRASLERVASGKSRDEVARELGMNLLMTGEVQEKGDQLRIGVTLRDLADRRQLWTHTYTGTRGDLLSIQEQAFSSVLSALGTKATSAQVAGQQPSPNGSGDAYDLYLRGRDTMRGFKDAKDIQAAIDLYEEALRRNPQFASAYSGLADACLEMYGQKSETFWVEKALHSAQQAIALNPRLPDARLALGSVYAATGDVEQAVAELKRAIELQPKSEEGYRRLGSALLASGRTDEALTAYQKAIELSPYYPDNYQMLGDAYLEIGENLKALGAYRRVMELDPGNAAGHGGMGAAYFQSDQWSACIPEFQKALQLHPDWDTYSNLGLAYFYLKQYDDAVRMFEKAVEMNPTATVVEGNLADAYRWSGQKDKATATYERAIELTNRQLRVNPRDASAMGSLALYYAKTSDIGQALTLVRRARAINPSDVELMYTSATVNALAGKQEAALASLKLALSKGYSTRQAANDPELRSLQGLPEFAKLIERYGPNAPGAS
ncbi:MAG TPA: tetratricopeptide repeat protein [Terriglobia bacterium]|nr:tetratricopeptide repeat protein [Terriglobia bacterium]